MSVNPKQYVPPHKHLLNDFKVNASALSNIDTTNWKNVPFIYSNGEIVSITKAIEHVTLWNYTDYNNYMRRTGEHEPDAFPEPVGKFQLKNDTGDYVDLFNITFTDPPGTRTPWAAVSQGLLTRKDFVAFGFIRSSEGILVLDGGQGTLPNGFSNNPVVLLAQAFTEGKDRLEIRKGFIGEEDNPFGNFQCDVGFFEGLGSSQEPIGYVDLEYLFVEAGFNPDSEQMYAILQGGTARAEGIDYTYVYPANAYCCIGKSSNPFERAFAKTLYVDGFKKLNGDDWGFGVSSLDELSIDVDKDWQGKNITNLGGFGIGTDYGVNAEGIAVFNAVYFGTGNDTYLYRSGPNILKTDDSFNSYA